MITQVRRADAARRWVLLAAATYGVVAVALVPVAAGLLRPLLGVLGVFVVQLVLLTGVPLALLLGLLRGGFRQTGAIEELGAWLGGGRGGRPDLQTALAQTLGDETLRLIFWAPERTTYVGGGGHVVDDRTALDADSSRSSSTVAASVRSNTTRR